MRNIEKTIAVIGTSFVAVTWSMLVYHLITIGL